MVEYHRNVIHIYWQIHHLIPCKGQPSLFPWTGKAQPSRVEEVGFNSGFSLKWMLHFSAGFGPCPVMLVLRAHPSWPPHSLSYRHSPVKAASECLYNLQCFNMGERKRCHSASNGSPPRAPPWRNPFLPFPVQKLCLLELHTSASVSSLILWGCQQRDMKKSGLKKVYLKQLQDVFCYFCKRDEEGTSFNAIAIVKIWLKNVQFVCML